MWAKMKNHDYEWDEAKDRINQEKHGISFKQAQYAFDDPNRIIIRDLDHGQGVEERFFCLGKVEDGILTVRFTYRQKRIRIYGAGYWREGKDGMSKKIIYTDEPMQMGERVKDFLPSPGQLAKRNETVKITLELTRESLDFFKEQARREHVPYQRMLRGLIDHYAKQYGHISGAE